MKQNEFENLKNKFLEGSLTEEEEKNLRSERKNAQKSTDDALSIYLKAMDSEIPADFTPLSKDAFFRKVNNKKTITLKGKLMIAASVSVLILLTYISYDAYEDYNKKTTRQDEIEQAIRTTRMALNSFSKNLNNNLNSINEGIDFSLPINSMKQLKHNKYETHNNTHHHTANQR